MVDQPEEGVDKQKVLAEVDQSAREAAPAPPAEGEAPASAAAAPVAAAAPAKRGSILLARRREISAAVMIAVAIVWVVVAAGSLEWLWPFLMALLFGGLGCSLLAQQMLGKKP